MAFSPLQEGLYSLTALAEFVEGESADDPYLIGMAADISGVLDVALLRDCATKMLTRHPNLRASFFSRGIARPVQIVPSRVELPWRTVTAAPEDVQTLEVGRTPATVRFGARAGDALPADRIARRPMAFGAHRPPHRDRRLVAAGIRQRDDDACTRPAEIRAALPVAPRPYRDYIGWLASRDPEASQQIWRQHLAGLPGPTLLSAALGSVEAAEGQQTALPRTTELRTAARGNRRPTGRRRPITRRHRQHADANGVGAGVVPADRHPRRGFRGDRLRQAA